MRISVRLGFIASLAASCWPVPLIAKPISTARTEKIDADVSRALKQMGVPGAVVLVMKDGRISYLRAFGVKDLASRNPVDVETHFEIGSITKQFTAASIMQLQEAGKLRIDSPLADYLPDAPHANEVTLRQLLDHSSGLHDYLDLPPDQMDRLITRPIGYAELIGRIASLPLDFKPGSQWSYSNTGYLLLGKVIEAVSGQTYRDYLETHFFRPLHLTQTFTTAEEARLPNMARGYRHVSGAIEVAPVIDASWGGAAGFLVTTARDLARWNSALRKGDMVSPASYHQMIEANGQTGYGLGLFVGSKFDQPRIGHTGGSIGFTTADEYFPRQRTRIIAFTNLGDEAPEAGETLTNIVFADLYPAIVKTARTPAVGENRAITQLVARAFGELQAGKAYSSFDQRLKHKLNGETGPRYASALRPYGAISAAIFRGSRETQEQRWFDYVIYFAPGVSLPVSIRTDANDVVAGFSVG